MQVIYRAEKTGVHQARKRTTRLQGQLAKGELYHVKGSQTVGPN